MPPSPARLPLPQARALLHTSRFHHTHQCLCGRPQFEHSGARKNGGHPRTRCRRYRADPAYDLARAAHAALNASHVDVVNDWQSAEYPRPTPRQGGTGVGPSSHGRCKRQIQYDELGLPPGYEKDTVDQDAAIIGQIIHDGLLRAYAHQFPWRLTEHPVWIPGMDRPGRVDMFDPVTALLSDIKTMSEHSWEDYVEQDNIPDYMWKQVLTYGYALTRQGHQVETLEIIAVRRSTGEVRYFHRDYDETSGLASIGELRALNANIELARLGVLELPRLPDFGSRNPLCARFCEYKSACLRLSQNAGDGRLPESRIELGDPAEDAKVAHAAGQLRKWRKIKRDAEGKVDRYKALLIGIPAGVYGPWKIVMRVNKNAQYSEYYTAVQEAADTGTPPEEIGLINVRYSTSEWHDVRPAAAGKTRTPTTAPTTQPPTEA